MRAHILQMLRETKEGYVSGEEVSQRLAVSRTAIWKHIQALKSAGYVIEAHSRLGYRLCGGPDLLLPEEILSHLSTERLGRAIRYVRETSSTNNDAKALAATGCPEGQIVVAETQDGGRGRLARNWFSPFGKGVWLSVVLRPPFAPQEAPKCTMMAAVATQRAIAKVSGLACGIKWPNDILYGGKKLVGILTEMSSEMDAINYIVIGIGINVNIAADEFSPELEKVATSLLAAGGRRVSRLELTAALLSELEIVYGGVKKDGFGPMLDEWRKLSVTLGRPVDVSGAGISFSGLATDIDADGALLVQTVDGFERVLAGDVSLRPKM